MVQEPTMVQPVVQQFDAQQFEIHEDRSITVAINTKKKAEIPEASLVIPEDKENANQFIVPAAVPLQVFNGLHHIIIVQHSLSNFGLLLFNPHILQLHLYLTLLVIWLQYVFVLY